MTHKSNSFEENSMINLSVCVYVFVYVCLFMCVFMYIDFFVNYIMLWFYHRYSNQIDEIMHFLTRPLMSPELNELIDLLDQFNIQPSLTPASAQHRLTLSEQRLARNAVVNPHTIEYIVLHLQKLENLNLSYWTTLTDKAAQAISMHGHCLTYLNLIGCKSVTKKGLKYLSDLCERKSTCITLGKEWMITPNATYSFESSSGWASASSDEESRTKRSPLSKRPSRQIGTKTLIVKA